MARASAEVVQSTSLVDMLRKIWERIEQHETHSKHSIPQHPDVPCALEYLELQCDLSLREIGQVSDFFSTKVKNKQAAKQTCSMIRECVVELLGQNITTNDSTNKHYLSSKTTNDT